MRRSRTKPEPPGPAVNATFAPPPPLSLTADDAAALVVGLGDRGFDATGHAYRDLAMPEGFELRFRYPRATAARFRLRCELRDDTPPEALAAQVDYVPVPLECQIEDGQLLASGPLPADPARQAAVIFLTLPPSAAPAAERLRFLGLDVLPLAAT